MDWEKLQREMKESFQKVKERFRKCDELWAEADRRAQRAEELAKHALDEIATLEARLEEFEADVRELRVAVSGGPVQTRAEGQAHPSQE